VEGSGSLSAPVTDPGSSFSGHLEQAEPADAVDRAGISAFRGTTSLQPARQLILDVRLAQKEIVVDPTKKEGWRTFSDQELHRLFERFSLPMVRPCTTSSQKLKALGIAKILWLRLVSGTDTEGNIYEDLRRILRDVHDDNVALGSMYFFKMKTELTAEELRQLKNHYNYGLNFLRLEEWEPLEPTD